MSAVFAGWEARLEQHHPAVSYLGWLLRSNGACVVGLGGKELSAAALAFACGQLAETRAPWQLTLRSPDGRATYQINFVGIDRLGWESAGDAAAWGWGGLAAMTGEADGPPLAPGAPLASLCAALHAMLAICAARAARLAQIEVTVPLGDVVASLIEVYGLRYAADGSVRTRSGDWSGLAGWGVYQCRDGKVAIALRDREQLGVLADLLNRPQLKGERFTDFMWGLCAAVDEANAFILSGLIERSVNEVVAGLRAARIAVAPVCSLAELLRDPHLTARAAYETDDGLRLPRFPVRGITGPSPVQGSFSGVAAPSTRPLAGVRVLDLSTVWAGPMAARLLADLGAEVIKLERPEARAGTYRTGQSWDRSLYAILNDRNKRTCRCDLRDVDDRRAFFELVRQADILIENFVPGSLERLGAAREVLHALNPRLTIVSMPAMGLTGPDAVAVGYGCTIEQAAGIGWLYADASGEPHRSGINFSDPIAGLYAAIGALLALSEAGIGAAVEVSQQEAALSLMLPVLARFQHSGELPVAVPALQRETSWAFPLCEGHMSDLWVPVREIPEVVGQPDEPGSRSFRWVLHPDGKRYPLVVLPWRGAFSAAVEPQPAEMPTPLTSL